MGVTSTSIFLLKWAAIRDFSNLCGMEVCNVEKPYVCTDVAVRTSSWSSDDNRHVGFFSIHMLFASLRLVLVAQYLSSPSLVVDSNLVRRHDKSSVVYLLEPAMKRCFAFTGASNKTMLKRGLMWFWSPVQIWEVLVLLRHLQTHRVDKVGTSP